MIDFLIMYEIEVRELDSVVLLGMELERRGYSVRWMSFEETSHNSYIRTINKRRELYNNVDTVLIPSLYNDNELYNTVYCICGSCRHIVNLRWEQYAMNRIMDYPEKSHTFGPSGDARKAYHLCWGKWAQDSMIRAGLSKSQLPVVGAMQLDFLRNEFQSFYKSKEELLKEYGIDYKKKSLVFLSSFAKSTERLKEHIKKDFDGNYSFDVDCENFNQESYTITLSWIEQFLQKNPDIEFIYRPHPAELFNDEFARLKKYDNFYVLKDYSVKQWIIVCDIVVTWVSTSIAEAYFADKNVYIIRPLTIPYDNDICLYRNAEFITRIEDFLAIGSKQAGTSIDEKVLRYAYSIKSKPAYLRFADAVESIRLKAHIFQWTEKKKKQFDKKRRWLYLRNLVFNVYIILLAVLDILQIHTGVHYPHAVESRVENFHIGKNNKKGRTYEVKGIKKRLVPIITEIAEKYYHCN